MNLKKETRRYIRCVAGGEDCFIEMSRVVHIAHAEEISRNERSSGVVGWVEGAGGAIPIVRIHAEHGISPQAWRAVVLNAERPWGLAVDEISTAIEIGDFCVHSVPAIFGDTVGRLLGGIIAMEGSLTPLISPDGLRAAPCEEPQTPFEKTASAAVAPAQDIARRFANLIVFHLDEAVGFGDDQVALSLSASQVLEILNLPHVTPVPGSPSHLRGVVSWRNRVLPVMDASVRLGLSGQSFGNPERLVVVAGVDGQPPVGLLASRDVRMMRVPLHQKCPAQALEHFPMIKAAVEVESQTLIVPNLRMMFAA